VGQLCVPAQLAVEDPGQQLEDGDQPPPGRHLLVVEPARVHGHIIPPK
jgi:hypothetical protein